MSPNAEARIRCTSILVEYVVDKMALRHDFHRVLKTFACIIQPMLNIFPMAGQPFCVFSLLSFQYHTQSNTDTTHTLGLLWTSDRPVAETSTKQYKKITRDKHPCPPARFEPALPADESLRPRGHRDRQLMLHSHTYFVHHPCYIIQ
jgi:hypothetical protein